MARDWWYLILAGFFEIGFTTFLKLSDSFTKAVPTLAFFLFSLLSFWFLNRAIGSIPLGIAYSIWTGIGAAGTLFIGVLFFKDQMSVWQLLLVLNLIASIIFLKFLG